MIEVEKGVGRSWGRETSVAEQLLPSNFSSVAVSLTPVWSVNLKCSSVKETEKGKFIDKNKTFGRKGPGSTTWQTTAWPIGTVLISPPALRLSCLFSTFATWNNLEELVSHTPFLLTLTHKKKGTFLSLTQWSLRPRQRRENLTTVGSAARSFLRFKCKKSQQLTLWPGYVDFHTVIFYWRYILSQSTLSFWILNIWEALASTFP